MIAIKRLLVIFGFFLIVGFGLILGSPENVWADAKYTFKPHIQAYGGYESNFYKSEENPREVYSYVVKPGFEAAVESEKAKAKVYYTLEAFFYEDRNDIAADEIPADEDDYIGHLLGFETRYTPARRLTLGLDDTLYKTQDPSASDRFSDSIDRRTYWINRFTPMVYYDFENRFSVGGRYRWTIVDYDEDEALEDHNEHRFLFNLLYNPNRSSTLDFEYQHWWLDYKNDLNDDGYAANQLMATFQKRYKYTAFDAGIGYQSRGYDDSTYDDQDLVTYRLAITYQNPPPPETTRYLGKQFVRAKSHAHLAWERNFNNTGFADDLHQADRITASVGHVFFNRFLVRLRGYYQYSDYLTFVGLTPAGTPEFRQDDIYHLAAELKYLFKNDMSVGVTVGVTDRDSNLAGDDYTNEFVALAFEYNFDLANRANYTTENVFYQ